MVNVLVAALLIANPTESPKPKTFVVFDGNQKPAIVLEWSAGAVQLKGESGQVVATYSRQGEDLEVRSGDGEIFAVLRDDGVSIEGRNLPKELLVHLRRQESGRLVIGRSKKLPWYTIVPTIPGAKIERPDGTLLARVKAGKKVVIIETPDGVRTHKSKLIHPEAVAAVALTRLSLELRVALMLRLNKTL